MKRQWRRAVVGLASLAAFGYLYGVYRREKAQALKALRAGSETIPVGDGVVEYAVRGQGKPVLILHGGGGGYEQGLAIAELLGLEQHQVIAISRPGHRRTPLAMGRTPAEQAAVARALLEQLAVGPVVVVGVSAGGLTHGPALKKLQPAPYWLWLLKLMMASDFLLWLVTKVGIWALIRLSGNDVREGDFGKIAGSTFPASDWREGTINDMGQVLSLAGMPLETIRVPALVVHGLRDLVVPYEVAAATKRRIPEAQLVTIHTGTHLMVATDDGAIGKAVNQFIERY
jgi:pimeloyl-ACP methyl ester carboxylesterase